MNCTVCASSAFVFPGSMTPLNSPNAPCFIARMRSIENTTSSAVIGLPSWNFAPGLHRHRVGHAIGRDVDLVRQPHLQLRRIVHPAHQTVVHVQSRADAADVEHHMRIERVVSAVVRGDEGLSAGCSCVLRQHGGPAERQDSPTTDMRHDAPPTPSSVRRSCTTLSRVRVCQRERRPIGVFSTSGSTFNATNTGPGSARIPGSCWVNSGRSVKANARG